MARAVSIASGIIVCAGSINAVSDYQMNHDVVNGFILGAAFGMGLIMFLWGVVGVVRDH